MSTTQLNGESLRQLVKSQFTSVDQMIEASSGHLTRRDRPAVYRALQGQLIKTSLADALGIVLGFDETELSTAKRSTMKDRLTLESDTFYAALRLIRNHCRSLKSGRSDINQGIHHSIDSLQNELDVPDRVFAIVVSELKRTRCIEVDPDGSWRPTRVPLKEVTRLLKRRIIVQWSMVRDVCSKSRIERRQVAREIRDLALNGETKAADPVPFFSLDDKIHVCFCADIHEAELLQGTRAVSWGIAHMLTTDLIDQSAVDPVAAERSMRSIAGPMLEDYMAWCRKLESRRVPDLNWMRASLRRHVLRMRDYAQYYETIDNDQGAGKSKPGSIASC